MVGQLALQAKPLPGQQATTPIAYLLLVLIAAPLVTHRRWPLPSLAVCLAALLITDDGSAEPASNGDRPRPGRAGGPGESGAASPGTGHGIIGMRERVAVFGGEFTAGPRPGGGFRVFARLPFPEVTT
jgi:hypothetical protein